VAITSDGDIVTTPIVDFVHESGDPDSVMTTQQHEAAIRRQDDVRRGASLLRDGVVRDKFNDPEKYLTAGCHTGIYDPLLDVTTPESALDSGGESDSTPNSLPTPLERDVRLEPPVVRPHLAASDAKVTTSVECVDDALHFGHPYRPRHKGTFSSILQLGVRSSLDRSTNV
jgi:hypothetical protein